MSCVVRNSCCAIKEIKDNNMALPHCYKINSAFVTAITLVLPHLLVRLGVLCYLLLLVLSGHLCVSNREWRWCNIILTVCLPWAVSDFASSATFEDGWLSTSLSLVGVALVDDLVPAMMDTRTQSSRKMRQKPCFRLKANCLRHIMMIEGMNTHTDNKVLTVRRR